MGGPVRDRSKRGSAHHVAGDVARSWPLPRRLRQIRKRSNDRRRESFRPQNIVDCSPTVRIRFRHVGFPLEERLATLEHDSRLTITAGPHPANKLEIKFARRSSPRQLRLRSKGHRSVATGSLPVIPIDPPRPPGGGSRDTDVSNRGHAPCAMRSKSRSWRDCSLGSARGGMLTPERRGPVRRPHGPARSGWRWSCGNSSTPSRSSSASRATCPDPAAS